MHLRRILVAFTVLAMCWVVRPVESAAFEDLDALFVVSGRDYADTLRAEAAIVAAGGRVKLIFPNRVILGRIDRAAAASLRAHSAIDGVEFGEVAAAAGLRRPSGEERAAVEFWNESIRTPAPQQRARSEHDSLQGDALIAPPLHPALERRSADIQVATPLMGGRIVQTVFFVESNGDIDEDTENWGEDWKRIRQQVIAGLKYWADRAPRKMRLRFVVKFHRPRKSQVSYEPIGRSSRDERLWIGELMAKNGFPDDRFGGRLSYFGQVFAFNTKQARRFRATGGAVSEFIVASQNDSDGRFTDGGFAYAYLGGPFTVLTYDNNGWGPRRFNMVQRHENGHLTGRALDEYSASGCRCSDRSPNGTQNLNCAACSSAACVMKSNSAPICTHTRTMIGWN